MFIFPKAFNLAMKSKLSKLLNKKPEKVLDDAGALSLKGKITYTR